jgi:hypothetical protein
MDFIELNIGSMHSSEGGIGRVIQFLVELLQNIFGNDCFQAIDNAFFIFFGY